MPGSQTLREKFISVEEQNQPQLRTLKKQFMHAILGAVAIFTSLSLVDAVPIERFQPFALALGFGILLAFLLLAGWRIWEFIRFELGTSRPEKP